MTILGPYVEIPSGSLKLIFSLDLVKPTSCRLEIYCLDVLGKMPSRGFKIIFTPSPKESNKEVLHEA